MTGQEASGEAKRLAALAAIAEVRDDMVVGLGTGSTAAFAIAALGDRVASGLRVTAVATSLATEAAARTAGIPLIDFADVVHVDLCIDGADEVDPSFRAIKGAGGALLREKIVAASARRMICIVDRSKLVDRLGAVPVPVEVLPFARAFVVAAVAELGGTGVVRTRHGETVSSDQGNLLIDFAFERIDNPDALGAALDAVPGILGHGLFLREIDAVRVGDDPARERP